MKFGAKHLTLRSSYYFMETNAVYQNLVRHAHEMLCAVNAEGQFVVVSDASSRLLGYDSREMEGKHFSSFVHPADIAPSLQLVHRLLAGEGTEDFVNRYLHRDGHEVPLLWTVTWSEEDRMLYCTGRDATPQHRLRPKVAEKEAFFGALLEHNSDMLALLDKSGAFQYMNKAVTRLLGYEQEHLLCTNACTLVHPDDIPAAAELWEKLESQKLVRGKDLRLRDREGKWHWVEVIVSNQLDNPAIAAFVVSSRDITERKMGRLKLEESEQRYRALFDNNPDIVIFENREGMVTEVNPAFREIFGLESEKIIGKPIARFLPPDMAAVNERSLKEALLGTTLRYDLELPAKGNRSLVLDTVKFPVPAGGQVIGAQTIAKDITPIVRSFETIERQSKKINTIFESITDAFFTVDKDWRYTYVNSEFERITGSQRYQHKGRHILEGLEGGPNNEFYQQLLKAAQTGSKVHFEAFSRQLDKWLEVKTFPSEEGLAVYFSDVTEKMRAKQEAEKLSLVASKTDNGVVITDAAGLTEWVNEGFTRMTGYTLQDMLGKTPGSVLQGPETDKEALRQIEEDLERGNHFNAKLVNYRKNGERFWISLDITPIRDEAGHITHYIAIQRDITYQKETEDNLLQLTQHLYEQNKDLQEFSYIVSHNLRAPVVNALGLAHLLQKTYPESGMYKTALTFLKNSLLKMDTVLRDVNTVLTVRERETVLDTEEVSLVEVFRQAQAQLQEPLLRHKCEIIVDMKPGLRVRANGAYLFSIFFNLLSNAIKYRSEERRLQVRLQTKRQNNGSLVVSFSDNGTGFDLDKAGEDVFKLYKRFHKNKKGRGMGLFLMKAHVEAMGWQVQVQSEVGKGTTFLIHIPL